MLSETEIVSGGNFRTAACLASDFYVLQIAELANISERRLYQLVCGLQACRIFNFRTRIKFRIYDRSVCGSRSSQQINSIAVHRPLIRSSVLKGQEDHVIMAANAGIRCNKSCSTDRNGFWLGMGLREPCISGLNLKLELS